MSKTVLEIHHEICDNIKEVYEKNVSDINAKTEIIQAQDRTLELRLEQLNTEQSALQNEMEAVKKVVDKHVELGFKTFGG